MKCPVCKNKEIMPFYIEGDKFCRDKKDKKVGELSICKKCGIMFVKFYEK